MPKKKFFKFKIDLSYKREKAFFDDFTMTHIKKYAFRKDYEHFTSSKLVKGAGMLLLSN